MKNRIINGIGIAFHSIGFYASAAVIIRMLIAIVTVNKIGTHIRYDAVFGDEFSALLMFLTGFFMCRKHTGLCASVNLSPDKRLGTAVIAAILLSAFLALFDIAMVKEYFSTFSKITQNTAWEKLFIHVSPGFMKDPSNYCLLLLLKQTLIYNFFFITGYSVRHILFIKPALMLLWVLIIPLSLIAVAVIYLFTKNAVALIFVVFALAAGYIFAAPVVFGYFLIIFCMPENSAASIISIMLMWLGCIASSARLVNRFKFEIPKEKRKGATV